MQKIDRDFVIDCGKISKLVNGLNPQKARGHDRISIRMMKLRNLTVTKPPDNWSFSR